MTPMDPFRQLQALSLLAMALLIAPGVVPPLSRFGGRMRLAALVVYLVGGLAILANWLLTRH